MTPELESAIQRLLREVGDLNYGEVALTVRVHRGVPVGFEHSRSEKLLAAAPLHRAHPQPSRQDRARGAVEQRTEAHPNDR